jgi:hypothetical protein
MRVVDHYTSQVEPTVELPLKIIVRRHKKLSEPAEKSR